MREQAEHDGLYAIGALAKMAGVSTDTLRYYDEIGLLRPARIAGETGYRYYTDDEAAVLRQIVELKRYGFSLDEIGEVIGGKAASIDDIYLSRYWALEAEKKKLEEAIDKLSDKIKQRQGDFIMNKKVLLVDDAPFMRSICRDILAREGYEVAAEAADGLEAVALYKSLKPDLVLLDIVMPNLDGIGALREIMEYDKDANIVMVSALSGARVIAEALLAGARDFLCKPFQTEDLLEKAKTSFTRATAVNPELARKILSVCADDRTPLDNYKAGTLVSLVRSDAGPAEAEAVIELLKKGSPAERQGYDHAIEERAHLSARLDNLERDVTEILGILRKR